MILNTLFYDHVNRFIGGDADTEFSPYEEYIIRYYEDQSWAVRERINSRLKREKIIPNCFDIEVDVYNTGGPKSTACITTYHLIVKFDLPKPKQRKLQAIFSEIVRALPPYVDLLGPFQRKLEANAGGKYAN